MLRSSRTDFSVFRARRTDSIHPDASSFTSHSGDDRLLASFAALGHEGIAPFTQLRLAMPLLHESFEILINTAVVTGVGLESLGTSCTESSPTWLG